MDKKSFIRGFGIGVLFAVVILSISFSMHSSDQQIIKKAKKLGMTFEKNRSLFQTSNQEEPTTTENTSEVQETPVPSKAVADTEKKKQEVTEAPSSSPKVVAEKNLSNSDTSEKTEENKSNDKKFKEEKTKMEKNIQDTAKKFKIQAGEWSSQVSKNLETQDIISDADDFDKYLNKNGFGDDIRAGDYKIPADADYEEIAKLITSK